MTIDGGCDRGEPLVLLGRANGQPLEEVRVVVPRHKALMQEEGSKGLEGMAPPGDLEHKIQDWIDGK